MGERNDNETQYYRQEQGKNPSPDQHERIGDVPLAPSSAGVIAAHRCRKSLPWTWIATRPGAALSPTAGKWSKTPR
jgi:hypothetical protein